MDINDYITSGILERYVSGTATPQERQEVECMSHIYPELKTELSEIEVALEGFARAAAIAPPESLKKNLFEAIDKLELDRVVSPKIEVKSDTTPLSVPAAPTNVVTMKPRINYLAAASFALLLLTSGLYYLNNQSQNRALAETKSKLEAMRTADSISKNLLADQAQSIMMLTNPTTKAVRLAGLPTKDAKASMVVYWNPEVQELYVGQLNLPVSPSDKQYQLWALADGKPISLGVFDGTETTVLKLNTIAAAQAFAVTLEPRGGSVSPTMEEMYVMGNI